MLTDKEQGFLTMLRDERAGSALCTTNPPSKGLQSLVDRGYCKLSPARSGPLGILTGDVFICLTEAGLKSVQTAEKSREFRSHRSVPAMTLSLRQDHERK